MTGAHIRPYPMKCGHTIDFTIPPKVGDYVFCVRCDKPTLALRYNQAAKPKIVAKRINDYHMVCQGCTRNRYIEKRHDQESDERTMQRARSAARSHAHTHRHTVRLEHPGRKVVETFDDQVKGQMSLFDDHSAPDLQGYDPSDTTLSENRSGPPISYIPVYLDR